MPNRNFMTDVSSQVKGRGVYLLRRLLAAALQADRHKHHQTSMQTPCNAMRAGDLGSGQGTYDRALIFLLFRLRRRTRFFLHLALILELSATSVSTVAGQAGNRHWEREGGGGGSGILRQAFAGARR